MSDLFTRISLYLKGIYDEYTTGDGYGDGDYAYDGYPGIVPNPKAELSVRNWNIFALAMTGTPDHNDFS